MLGVNSIKSIKVYKNSTIRLPYHLLKKLGIKEGSHLAIEERSYGFVLCKLEVYDTLLGQFEADMQMFDKEIRDASTTLRKLLSGLMSKRKEVKQIEDINQKV